MDYEESLSLLTTKPGNVKNAIIQKLSKQWPLTVKQLDHALKREYGLEVTYQAVHKALHELKRLGTLESSFNKYQLSRKWIEKIGNFTTKLGETYAKNESIDYNKDIILLKFSNWVTMGRFMGLNFKIDFPNPESKPTICNWIHVWPSVTLSTEEIQKLEQIHSQCRNYSVCPNSTPMDKLFSEWLNSVGNNSKTGQSIHLGHDYIIRGNYVGQIHYTEDFIRKISNLYENTLGPKSLDYKSLQKLATMKTSIVTVIINNSELADHLRGESLSYFNQK